MKVSKRLINRPKTRLPRHVRTAETIGRRIMGGHLAPGSVLPNAALMAQEYNLSRPAMREAMKFLAGKGLISAAPRRGTIVRPRSDWNRLDDDLLAWEADEAPTPGFIRDLYEVRRMIEPEAAAMTASRGTDEGILRIGAALERMGGGFRSEEWLKADIAFHREILMQSGNDFLTTFAPLIGASLRIAFEAQRSTDLPGEYFVAPHYALFQTIKDRRVNEARVICLDLLVRSQEDALSSPWLSETWRPSPRQSD